MDLHPHQRQALSTLPAQQSIVLLTRHSVREQATNDMPGFDVPLTPEGVLLAELWGGELGRVLSSAYSSHSPRCVDTGEAMLRGAKSDVEVSVIDLLCEPGCYVEEIKKAGPFFKELGPLAFANQILSGDVPGAYPARQTTLRILDWIEQVMPEQGEITLGITHDTILGTLIHDLIESEIQVYEDWPLMMEGAFFWCDTKDWYWIWRGQLYQKSRQELAEFNSL